MPSAALILWILAHRTVTGHGCINHCFLLLDLQQTLDKCLPMLLVFLERVKFSKSEYFWLLLSFCFNKNKPQQNKKPHVLISLSATAQLAVETHSQWVNSLMCNCKQNCKKKINIRFPWFYSPLLVKDHYFSLAPNG